MRGAIYARFSTDQQRESSIDDQFRVCDRISVANGFHTVARFSDAGITGGTTERPGYQALLAAARSRQCDVIIAEDISRLWRNRAEFGSRSAELEDLEIHLVTAVGDDTRRDGWGLVLGIKQAIAEHARREISYRTRRGLEGLALAGKSTGGRCYGYAPGEAQVVQGIFERAAGGMVPSRIARYLNADGIPGPRGPHWSLNAVKRVLVNIRYKGVIAWGVTETRGGAQDSRHKRHIQRAGGPLVCREAPEARLVPVALWEAANAA